MIDHLLNLRGRIVHKTRAESSGVLGAVSKTYTPGVLMAIQAGGSQEAVRQASVRGVTVYTVFMPHGTDVGETDAIDNITGDGVWQGRELAVTGPPIDHAGRGTYYAVTAIEVGGGAQR